MTHGERNQKGQVLILVTTMLVVLLGIAALALDFGRAYGIRAKLNAAVDVASIAAGKVASQGSSAIGTRATDVFKANFPRGLLGSTVADPVTDAQQNADGSWTIKVSATASLPTGFAGVFGWRNIPVSASATSNVRTLDMVLVLDSSNSLNTPSTTLDLLKSAVLTFIAKFDHVNDRLGLVRYASGSVLNVPITVAKGFSVASITDAVNSISFDGCTASEDAMRIAKAQLNAIPVLSRNNLRVIVLFTDGAPNTIAGTFDNAGTPVQGNLYSQVDDMDGNAATAVYSTTEYFTLLGYYSGIDSLPTTDYTGTVNLRSDLTPSPRTLETSSEGAILNNRCNVNRAARNMLENVANSARTKVGTEEPIRIFAVGLGASLLSQEVKKADGTNWCGYGDADSGQNILRRVANIQGVDTYNQAQYSGLYAYASDSSQLNYAFQQVANQILRLSK